MKKTILMLLVSFVLGFYFIGCGEDDPDPKPTSPCDVYVDVNNGNSTPAGTSTNPYTAIQDAVDDAAAGDQVCVAGGTYNEQVAIANKNLIIYGGYKGSDAGANTSYDWSTRDKDIYITSITDTTGTAGGGETNPNFAVKFDGTTTAITSSTIIDGFSITGANVGQSAAIFCTAASPTIQNNKINGGSPTIAYIVYAIIISSASKPTIQDNTIDSGNGSSMGATLYGLYEQEATSDPALVSGNTFKITASTGGRYYGRNNYEKL